MDAEEKSRNHVDKTLYRIMLLMLKTIPYVLFLCHASSFVLSYLGKNREILSFFCGISLVPWIFILLSSYVFRFCKYHRLMIWYCGLTESIAWMDWKIGFPVTDSVFFISLFIITGIFIFSIAYFKIKHI